MPSRDDLHIFVRDGDWLLLDSIAEFPVPVPDGATAIDAMLVDYTFEMSASSTPAGDIAITLSIDAAEPHEFVVIQLAEGTTIADLISGDAPFESIMYFGGAWMLPEDEP